MVEITFVRGDIIFTHKQISPPQNLSLFLNVFPSKPSIGAYIFHQYSFAEVWEIPKGGDCIFYFLAKMLRSVKSSDHARSERSYSFRNVSRNSSFLLELEMYPRKGFIITVFKKIAKL